MKNNKLPVKISKYVFKIKQKQFFALYHSLTGEIIFGQYLLAAIYKYFSKLNKVDNFLKLRENRLSNNARKYLTELLALLLDKSFLSSNDNFEIGRAHV